MNLTIRRETAKDYDTVYQVVKAAFDSAEHSDGNEQDLVVALRKGPSYIPELALVACSDGEIIGHIMFTRVDIGGSPALALAPLAVLPDFQRQGVGSALVREGHRIAAELGFGYCVVLGSAQYYPKFGYAPASQFQIRAPFEVPEENFMAVRLCETAEPVSGTVRYDQAFGI